ncbi:MAG: ParB N-terminal domain-containing protein [Eubacteriaceae bacterium]
MNDLIIPVDGKETKIELMEIEIEKIELDELNPRISFFKDNQVNNNLSEDQIIFALANKKPEAFRKLMDSIHNNKGIVYPIWVEPKRKKRSKDKEYKVIEGNTRLLIYQKLKQEEPYEERWKTILCNILPHEIKEEQKNFIRLLSHLRGTTEWDAYEKAKYLYKLWQDDGWSINRLEKQTKMTEKQIKENIDAYRIMEEQYLPDHTDDPNEVSKFSYFVEYIKDSKLQKSFTKNGIDIKNFCDWVSNKEKIPTGQDVRRLRDIFDDEDIKNAFIGKGFDAAMQMLAFKKPHIASSFYRSIEDVIEGLKSINAHELDEIIDEENSEKENMIKELAKWSQKVIKLIEKEKDGLKKT